MPIIGITASSITKSKLFQATGGDEVKTVGSYRYHFFTGNGTFTVTAGSKTVDVTSVGGGGGGSRSVGGGGGAGELDILSAVAVNSTTGTYSITIGAGELEEQLPLAFTVGRVVLQHLLHL